MSSMKLTFSDPNWDNNFHDEGDLCAGENILIGHVGKNVRLWGEEDR